jgi:hypothetical protein
MLARKRVKKTIRGVSQAHALFGLGGTRVVRFCALQRSGTMNRATLLKDRRMQTFRDEMTAEPQA